MWKCGNCGYVWDGEEAPETCPKCGVGKDQYSKLDDECVKLIERSRKTNCIHTRLNATLCQVKQLARDGIEDDLDPGCVSIFTKALEQATQLSQSIKAELQGHMNKGKWG